MLAIDPQDGRRLRECKGTLHPLSPTGTANRTIRKYYIQNIDVQAQSLLPGVIKTSLVDFRNVQARELPDSERNSRRV